MSVSEGHEVSHHRGSFSIFDHLVFFKILHIFSFVLYFVIFFTQYSYHKG